MKSPFSNTTPPSPGEIELIPAGAIVLWINPARVPRVELPPELALVQHSGQPGFHVTVVGKKPLEKRKAEIARIWPAVSKTLPRVPLPVLDPHPRDFTDPAKGTRSWF